MRQRKGGKRQQTTSSEEPAAAATPPAASVSAAKRPANQPANQSPRPASPWTAPPPAAFAAASLLALLLLVYAYHAAVRGLAPQTGEWLASSFCGLALFALAFVAAVVGHAAEGASAALGTPACGIPAAMAWWAAAAAAGAVAALNPARLAGRWLLALGLSDSSRRITDTELTLRCMAVAAVAYGPQFAALGAAAGACGSRAAAALQPTARPLALLLPAVAGTACAALGWGLPPAARPPRLVLYLPPAIAAVAAVVAALLSPGPKASDKGAQRQRRRSRAASVLAAAVVACAAALMASANRQPCGPVSRELEGGGYRVLWECQAAAGGQLSVVEGTYQQQYRYRLLRLDHSVMGGEYTAPADVAGQSIYTAFYLQSAVALLRPGGSRSLHIGLGVGTAVKGMQRLGVAADVLELHPEVVEAARLYFELQPGTHGGRALTGDAAAVVPRLAGAGYDYIIHDVFSGGGIAPALMDERFFRQLSRALAPSGTPAELTPVGVPAELVPAGVLAVNYWGDRGPGLKQAWCRLRLVFDSVRAFSDLERSRVRNHVLFASHSDLSTANLTAAKAAHASGAAREGFPEPLDAQQLRVWQALEGQEIHLTFDRQRCQQMLRQQGATAPARGGGSLGSGESRGGRSGGRQQQQQGQLQRQLQRQPWVWQKMKEVRERHALATASWVALRSQFGDSFWEA